MTDKKTAIFEAAQALFREKGFRAVSMQEIADAAAMSKGALYLHFRSKAELVHGVLEQMDEALLAQAEAIRNGESRNARERLRSFLHMQLQDAVENREFMDMVLRELSTGITEELMSFIERSRFAWQRCSEGFLAEAYGTRISPFLIDCAVMMNGMLHEYHSFILIEQMDIQPDAVADFLVSAVEQLVLGLADKGVTPIFDPEKMPTRKALEEKIFNEAKKRARALAMQMSSGIDHLAKKGRETEELQESIRIILAELDKPDPSKILIQGMLANLRHIAELKESRTRLANTLGLRLI